MSEIADAIIASVAKSTKKWTDQRKREERHWRAALNRRSAMTRCSSVTLKSAAYGVMESAYLKASSGGTLPAHARQIMYAARSDILRRTGEPSLQDHYFTQKLLPDFMADHPDLTGGWDVVFDARGHFIEPHNKQDKGVPLGTIDVRSYLREVSQHRVTRPDFGVVEGFRYPTRGSLNRFGAILFVEKEGFFPLFEASHLGRRYDLALMSTKGVSNIASRTLIDGLSKDSPIPVYVMHDFDVDGFKIFGTLKHSTDRYDYENRVDVIDIGLRLTDVTAYDLESERAPSCNASITKLKAYGACDEEIEFLADRRVELNAFCSGDLIQWVESKLDKHGVKKLVPDRVTLADAYRRAVEVDNVYRAFERAKANAEKNQAHVKIPDNLEQRVHDRLRDRRDRAWDDVVAELATQQSTEVS